MAPAIPRWRPHLFQSAAAPFGPRTLREALPGCRGRELRRRTSRGCEAPRPVDARRGSYGSVGSSSCAAGPPRGCGGPSLGSTPSRPRCGRRARRYLSDGLPFVVLCLAVRLRPLNPGWFSGAAHVLSTVMALCVARSCQPPLEAAPPAKPPLGCSPLCPSPPQPPRSGFGPGGKEKGGLAGQGRACGGGGGSCWRRLQRWRRQRQQQQRCQQR